MTTQPDHQQPGIGVVVVAYDSASDLPACLAALRSAHDVGAIIVVDNGSSDDSARIAAAVPGVTAIAAAANLGFAGGCNRGLGAVPRDIDVIAFMNPDVEVDRSCFSEAIATFDRYPEIGAIAPLLMRPDGITVDSAGQVFKTATLEVLDLGYGTRCGSDGFRARPVIAACGALAIYRRAALDDAGNEGEAFDESFFCFWEDFELGWRLTNRGWPTRFEPSVRATHGRGAGAEPGSGPLRWRRPVELEACIVSNRWTTLLRHLHPLDLLLRLPILLVWDAALTLAGIVRRPRLLALLIARLPLVAGARRLAVGVRRRRLHELPRRRST